MSVHTEYLTSREPRRYTEHPTGICNTQTNAHDDSSTAASDPLKQDEVQ
jgi:hypothetical protein